MRLGFELVGRHPAPVFVMCTIAGFIGNRPAAPVLLEMLKREEGLAGGFYTGIATVHEGRLYCEKVVGDTGVLLRETPALNLPGTVGIAHSRTPSGGGRMWGHPFVDGADQFAYVENGAVGQYDNIPLLSAAYDQLLKAGHRFQSTQTESAEPHPALSRGLWVHFSEIMCQAIAAAYDPMADAPNGLLDAAVKAYESYPGEVTGLCLHALRPDEIVAVRHNKPLQIGRDAEGAIYLASTSLAFPDDLPWQMRMPPAAGMAIRRGGSIEIKPLSAKLIPLGSFPSALAIEGRLVDFIRRNSPCNMEQLFDVALGLWPEGVLTEKETVVFETLAFLLKEGHIELVARCRPGVHPSGVAPWTWVAWRH